MLGFLFLAISFLALLYGSHVFLLDLIFNRRGPPGPMPLPFIGSIYLSIVAAMGKKPKPRSWRNLNVMSKKYGPIFTLYVGQIRFVVLNNSKVIHEALVEKAQTFSWRQDTKIPGFEIIPEALITANYDNWRQRRRFGMKAMRDFGMGKAAMVTKIQDEIVHFLPELESRSGKAFDPHLMINNAVANIICNLVFGKRFSYDDVNFQELLHQLDYLVGRPRSDGLLFCLFPFIKHFMSAGQATDFLTFQKQIHAMVKQSVDEHRRDFDPDNIRDFPDLFIQSELNGSEGLDFEAFCLVMSDMFIAGSETTSTALAWTLIYLSTYPEIQQKCQQTIDEVLGDSANRLPQLEDRPRLAYVDAVMCEVLRHSSFVPASLYHSNLEQRGEIAGYDIAPYTMILYNVAGLHHDEKYWGDPENFRPERWLSADGKTLLNHSSHFMPFGIGPRICLGEALARVEYFIFIVSMLHRFRFSLEQPVDFNDAKRGVIATPPDFKIITQHR